MNIKEIIQKEFPQKKGIQQEAASVYRRCIVIIWSFTKNLLCPRTCLPDPSVKARSRFHICQYMYVEPLRRKHSAVLCVCLVNYETGLPLMIQILSLLNPRQIFFCFPGLIWFFMAGKHHKRNWLNPHFLMLAGPLYICYNKNWDLSMYRTFQYHISLGPQSPRPSSSFQKFNWCWLCICMLYNNFN